MKIEFEDTKFIRDQEGCRLTAYQDSGGVWTIGYGLTGKWVVKGVTITQEECQKHFMERIDGFCKEMDKLVKVPLNKNQYIALLSFTYNVGSSNLARSTMLRYINENRFTEAADGLLQWTWAGGKNLSGLKARRIRERELFLTL